MYQTVQLYIDNLQLLVPEQNVIVGLSGGADSVALLDLLVTLGYPCIAAHCNFHLRGEESIRDEEFARTFAEKLNVPFKKIDFDTREFAQEKHLSIEMAARELRYEWFERIRQEYNAQAIAVAHHQDDSVETFLLNLMRGTGLRGLTGIAPKNGYIVRPLLCVTREDIINYLKERGLDFVTDSTNLSDAYTRNFIRLNLIPMMEKITPSVRKMITRTSDYLSEAESIYLHEVEQARKGLWKDNKLLIKELLTYPAPKTILFELLRPYNFTTLVVDNIFDTLGKSSGKLFYSPTHRIIKDRDFLILSENKKVKDAVYTIYPQEELLELPIKLSFELISANISYPWEKDHFTAYFDFGKLTFPLLLRHWRHGDWFIPFGMRGRKKLSDYFNDNKFSLLQKEECWLLCSGDDIIWIIGERTDNRFRVTQATNNVIVVKFLGKNY
ncbi:tRNA lysidine(34) synthetase TilS [Parabacteroides pacaensis]|uniref:tRNA lysidine(34) synthetase TilS n=1 Tax=Parabacteroides pacaensis TaxID=2086575 RepID=UPI000D0F86D7|nr:tRNA lysidine(34) synthetase TilS [Parabacteroides pacaensis]